MEEVNYQDLQPGLEYIILFSCLILFNLPKNKLIIL